MLLRFAMLLLATGLASAFVAPVARPAVAPRAAAPVMGNDAPEGPFTPIVLTGKVVPPGHHSAHLCGSCAAVVHTGCVWWEWDCFPP